MTTLKDLQKRLSQAESSLCENHLTIEECSNVVKKFNMNKAPGHDGLCGEFYQTFWNDISSLVVNSFNYSLTEVNFDIIIENLVYH